MSRLDELIQELYPNGVDKIKLNEICKIYDGTHSTPQYKESGVKFVSVENINDLYSTTKYISEEDFNKYKIKPQIGDVFMTRIGSIGICNVVYRDEKLAYYVSLALLRPNTDIINSRYLKYAIESIHGRKELRKRTLVNAVPIKINKDDIGKVQIPVPPLEVQREIVRILDSFTLLTAELTAELTARKKQYEFYRRELLIFDESIPQFQLRDIASFRNGKGHEKNIADNGKYVVINSKFISTNGQVIKNSDEQLSPLYTDDIAMVMSDLPNGRALAKCYLIDTDDKFTLNQRVGGLHTLDENKVVTKYLFYILDRNWQLLKYDNGVDQTNLKKDDILNISIPVPAIDVQKRLVYVLDNFDAICSNLNSGLPAEIEVRQKQYEYYRDKLLNFKKLEK